MNTVTIPKEISEKGDLIVIPRLEYEGLLKRHIVVPVVKLTQTEKRVLERSRKEMAEGKYVTLEELENELGIANRRRR